MQKTRDTEILWAIEGLPFHACCLVICFEGIAVFFVIIKPHVQCFQLLFDVSLVVSRCKLLGEEVEYLTKWGAKYSISKTQVENNE